MPVKNPGSYPTSSDVFYSKNVFINGIEVALWNAPKKSPKGGGGSVASSGISQQTDTVAPATKTAELLPPAAVPTDSGFTSNQTYSEDSVVVDTMQPEPAVELPPKTQEVYAAQVAAYVANPDSFRMAAENVAAGNIKATFPGTLRNLSLDPLVSIAPKEPVVALTLAFSTLLTEGLDGVWKETGFQGFQSNKNIIGIFGDLGYDTNVAPFNSDQTPWSMAFVNWVLKRTGFRYTTSIDAYDIMNRASDYGATEVSISQAQVGDICLWNYGHVNFVNKVLPGNKLTFIGACQSRDLEPNVGTITESWKDGYDPVNNNGSLIKVFRPSLV